MKYIGTTIVEAKPCNLNAQDGYSIIYKNDTVFWSPKAVFEDTHRPCDSMTFGLAIEALKMGKKVSRAGWNGKSMWLVLARDWNASLGSEGGPSIPLADDWKGHADFIAMYTADKMLVPWLASQTDVLAEDWGLI